MTSMIDKTLARMRAHHSNIARYRWLLKTQLTELERGFIERRLREEQSALATLTRAALPLNRKTASGRARDPHRSLANDQNLQDGGARL